MNRKWIGIVLSLLLAVCTANATRWIQDAPVGAKWSETSNWEGGDLPASGDLALFQLTQANTYDVDVDTSGVTRLLQVMQPHTFNGSGSIYVATTANSQYQSTILYTTTGEVNYNVPVTVNISSTNNYYGGCKNNNGGTTVFNDAFTLEAGTGYGINLDIGTFEFNGDLTLNDTMRLGSGTTIIGGAGTTSIGGSGYILTSGTGTKLYLNRTGAYTVANTSTGYLRVERSKVYFNAPQAIGTGTDVKMYQTDATASLISGGDYDQEFGILYCSSSVNDAIIDMQNAACMWTFADCSGIGWGAPGVGLAVVNADTNNTVIRFKIDGGGTGLTSTQIDRTTVNGVALATLGTTVTNGYLYITQATSVPQTVPDIVQPSIVSSSMVSEDVMQLVVDAPIDASRYSVESTSGLTGGSWDSVAHSDDGMNAFFVTNLSYSTANGTNEVIYVQTTNSAAFFKIVGE
jgi:hypothetical protein